MEAEGGGGLRQAAARILFGALLVTAFLLFVLWRTENPRLAQVRLAIVDAVAPALETVAGPSSSIGALFDDVRSLGELQAENARLRERVERLEGWREIAEQLEEENARLRALSAVKLPPRTAYVTAEAIGDAGGPFAMSVLVNAGASDGVIDGAPALDARGLLGRVFGVGERTARVLLLTDPASRVPVTIGDAGLRAVMAGDATDTPRLDYLLGEASVPAGARVVTSGDGGVLPKGLTIGRVEDGGDGVARVRLAARLDRIDFMRITRAEGVEPPPPGGLILHDAAGAATGDGT